MLNEKINTSVMLTRDVRQKMKRISNILNRTESDLMADALQFYFEKSDCVKKAQEKIRSNEEFLRKCGLSKRSEVNTPTGSGWQYRADMEE